MTSSPPPTEVSASSTPPAGKKLCPHTCSCIVKYSSKERGRSALSTRGAAYWDHIKNTNVHPDCSPTCPGHSLLRAGGATPDSKEPPIKKQRMVGFGSELETEWGYSSGWQAPAGPADPNRERMEGLVMDTKSDINRWISGGSRPFVYTASLDTVPTSLKSYSAFMEAYGSELGTVLHFQRVPQPRNPAASSPSSTMIAPFNSAQSSAVIIATPISEQSPSSPTPASAPSIPAPVHADNSLLALSTTALFEAPQPDPSAPSAVVPTPSPVVSSQTTPLPIVNPSPISPSPVTFAGNPIPINPTPSPNTSSPSNTPSTSATAPPSSAPGSPPVSPLPSTNTGVTWTFVKVMEQRWDVRTWVEWYSKESTKKKHKNAYYLVNIPVRGEDHTTFKKDPVTAMLSHRGTLCLNQYISYYDELLPIPDMDAKLFLAPPWTGAVLTPPSIDRNRTQSLHRVIFGDGLNLVHIWEKLTEDQEHRFRKVVGLSSTHERQLHPFQLKCTRPYCKVWDRTKEEELVKWGILSNRIELMSGQTLIVPLDMPHVMKKVGPLPPSSSTHTQSHSSQSSSGANSFSPLVAGQPPQPSHTPLNHSIVSTAPAAPQINTIPLTNSAVMVPTNYATQTSFVQYTPANFQNTNTSPQQTTFTTYASPSFSTSTNFTVPPASSGYTNSTLSTQTYPSTQPAANFNPTNYAYTNTNYNTVYTSSTTAPATSTTAAPSNFANTSNFAPPYANSPINFPSNANTAVNPANSNAGYSPYFLGQPGPNTSILANPPATTYPSNTTASPARNIPYQAKTTTYTSPSAYSPSGYTTYGSPTKLPPTNTSITPIHIKNPSPTSFTSYSPPPQSQKPPSSGVIIPPPTILATYTTQHAAPKKDREEKKDSDEVKVDSSPMMDLSIPSSVAQIINSIHPAPMDIDNHNSATPVASSVVAPTKDAAPNAAYGQGPIDTSDQTNNNPLNGESQQIQHLTNTDQNSNTPTHIDDVVQIEIQEIDSKVPHQNGQSLDKDQKSLSGESATESKPPTKPQAFPVPLLTYSGNCSFVGTTRESFARNVDLMKYWHRQLRKDHQPASVHVDLPIYCLISYVVSSPSVLQGNPLLIEHFMGAVPHFREFVSEEGERVARYLSKNAGITVHTLLKKESRLDWICRKCKCHLTNFLVKFSPKNEASCSECWEEEEYESNKKEDKKKKDKKKVENKKVLVKGEAVFRFGPVESLLALANKAAKIVNKLNHG